MEDQSAWTAWSEKKPAVRDMVLTFDPDRTVRTPNGRLPVAKLRPGDRVLSGSDAGFSVLSVSMTKGPHSRGRLPVVKIVVGRDARQTTDATYPVAGHVSSVDGRLHMAAQPEQVM
jgi:hypothetical protein